MFKDSKTKFRLQNSQNSQNGQQVSNTLKELSLNEQVPSNRIDEENTYEWSHTSLYDMKAKLKSDENLDNHRGDLITQQEIFVLLKGIKG